MSRVQRVTTTWLVLSFVGVSILATVAVVPFWDTVTVSGTLFWSINLDEVSRGSERVGGSSAFSAEGYVSVSLSRTTRCHVLASSAPVIWEAVPLMT